MRQQEYDRDERDLLRDILNPTAYRLALAEKLRRRGTAIVRQEKRAENPYKKPHEAA
jgi:hypothetical protein